MGEHAVVYGAPALVAAVGLRARARVERAGNVAEGDVEIRLPDLQHREVRAVGDVLDYARRARKRWHAYRRSPDRTSFSEMRGEGAGHVTLVALGEALEAAADTDGAAGPLRAAAGGTRVEVRSEIPVGRGFGSSASVAAAVAAAWLARLGRDLSSDAMEALVGEVERRQHGDPSGVDAAAVLRGGLVWAEEAEGADAKRFRRTAVRPHLLEGFRLVDTGPPAESTGEVVSAVRERRDRAPGETGRALRRIREATLAFRDLLGREEPRREDAVEAIRACERGLEELGVVPGPVRRLVREVESRGGAAKISGAGSLTGREEGPPGGGLLLVYHPSPDRIAGWPFLADLEVLEVRPGAEGLREEPPR